MIENVLTFRLMSTGSVGPEKDKSVPACCLTQQAPHQSLWFEVLHALPQIGPGGVLTVGYAIGHGAILNSFAHPTRRLIAPS
jgi:hypothetical protein